MTFPVSKDHQICQFVIFSCRASYLKSQVYTIQPRTLEELKKGIHEEIRGIPAEMLQQEMRNLNSRLEECICAEGRNFQTSGLLSLKRQVVMV